MIIRAFSGAGKTYLAGKYMNIIDLEPMNYHWVYPEESNGLDDEKKKHNHKRVLNLKWPYNYIDEIIKYYEEGFLVLIGGDTSVSDELKHRNLECLYIAPGLEQKDDYLKRFSERKNTTEYILFWDKNFDKYVIENQMQENYVRMEPGEFLETTLIRIGII